MIARALVGCAIAAAETFAFARQAPAFRTSVELVTIDVSVRAGKKPEVGLKASDFALSDNGARQEITAISAAAVPLDVTLVMDVRGNFAGHVEQFKSDVLEIAGLLRPDDRIRVLTTGTVVKEAVPLVPSRSKLSLEPIEPDLVDSSGAALHDALLVALVKPADADRRHLVVAFTNLSDGYSMTTAQRLRGIAERVDGVLYVVKGSWSLRNNNTWIRMRHPIYGEAAPRLQRVVVEAAEATGGEMYDASFGGSIVPAFKRVSDVYRQSYLLQYELKGVAREGRHDVAVKVTRPGRYDIHARTGYFIEPQSR